MWSWWRVFSPHTGHSLVPSPDVYRSSFPFHCRRDFLQEVFPRNCRNTLKHEETQWNTKKHAETRKNKKHKETRWNTKKHAETRKNKKHEETQKNTKKHKETRRNTLKHERTRNTKKHKETQRNTKKHKVEQFSSTPSFLSWLFSSCLTITSFQILLPSRQSSSLHLPLVTPSLPSPASGHSLVTFTCLWSLPR